MVSYTAHHYHDKNGDFGWGRVNALTAMSNLVTDVLKNRAVPYFGAALCFYQG
jgi:hypothetical protein